MSQGLLIFSMIFSWMILGKRYDPLQARFGRLGGFQVIHIPTSNEF
jgi:hypothetical protein